MRRTNMLEGVVVLEVRRHHAGRLWWHRIFLSMIITLLLLFVVIVVTSALVFEVGGAFVFVGLAILDFVSIARQ